MKGINFRPENWKWDEFDKFCCTIDRIVSKVKADGFCLLNSVRSCLLHDYNEILTVNQMKQKITHHLCEQNAKFLDFHTGNANTMVNEVQDFFETGRFITSEVCDFLVSVIGEVFKLTIHVYQRKENGRIQLHSFPSNKPEREIYLKFTHDNSAPGSNHYDSIVKTNLGKKERSQHQEHKSSPEKQSQKSMPEEEEENSRPAKEPIYIPEMIRKSKNFDADVEVIDLTQEINTTGNTTGESSFSFDDAPSVKKGVSFPTYLYSKMEPTLVDKLPGEIDGTCWYRIKCSEKEYTEKSSDLRWFLIRTSIV